MGDPVVTIVTALPPATTGTPIVFTVVGQGFPIRRAWASIHFPGLIFDEVIHTGARFGVAYTGNTNTRVSIANGYQYTILRDGGWPVLPLATSFDISAVDTVGNGGGSSVGAQVYTYTILGTEPGFGTDDVTVPLETPKLSTSYQAIATDGGRVDSAQIFYTCPVAGYGLNTIVVHGTSAPAVGDKINITVLDNA